MDRKIGLIVREGVGETRRIISMCATPSDSLSSEILLVRGEV